MEGPACDSLEQSERAVTGSCCDCRCGALFLGIAGEPAPSILDTFPDIIRYEAFPGNQSVNESSQATKTNQSELRNILWRRTPHNISYH